MRLKSFLALIVICSGLPVFAENATYTRLTENLKRTQARTDLLLKKLHVGDTDSFGFATTKSKDEVEGRPLFNLHDELKSVTIPPGRLLFAKTVTRLVLGSDGSPAVFVISEAQSGLSGLRLLGVARPASNPGRVIVELNQMVTRTGRVISIHATALDEAGAYGLVAQVFSSKALSVAGAMASSFVGGFAASQQSQSSNAFGFSQVQPNGRNALLQGVAQTAADQTKRFIDDSTAEKPVLVVDPGTPVSVLIQEEVRL